jgi:hypothetical protein
MNIVATNILTLDLIAVVLLCGTPAWASQNVFKADGRYEDRGGKCTIHILTSPMGGFSQLHLPAGKVSGTAIVDDMTGAAFTATGMLVYTTSPIYGRPGVFLFNCRSKRTVRLVGPRHFDPSYPDGLDFFELSSVSDDKIFFYYAPDVNQVDIQKLRTPSHLYTVDVTGSRMRRADRR